MIDYNALQHFISTGNSKSMPENLVAYLELLELVRGLYSKYETRDFIINTLMSPAYGMSRQRSLQIYYDMLNFFYSDNAVKQKAWENIYADHLDKLAYYALDKEDIETARKCFNDAAKYRGVGQLEKNEIPPEMLQRPVIIYTINPEKVGIPAASRRELSEFIDNLPEISERERVRVKRDAGVFETTLFEDLVSNDIEDQNHQ
jgi:hypothetical protein